MASKITFFFILIVILLVSGCKPLKLGKTQPIDVWVSGYGAIPSDNKDDTRSIQKALSSGAKNIYFPDGVFLIDPTFNPTYGNYGGLRIKSNSNLILSPETVLQAIPVESGNYSILNISNVENVNIKGGCLRGEKNQHTGETGEWGMGLFIKGSKHVSVKEMTFENCWGDGVYIGATSNSWSEDITLDSIDCNSNRRNGMSIVSGRNIQILNSTFYKNGEVSPKAGIDLEPNNPENYIDNVLIQNCKIEDNPYRGFLIFGENGPIKNVKVQNCSIKRNVKNIDLHTGMENIEFENLKTDNPESLRKSAKVLKIDTREKGKINRMIIKKK